MVLLHSTIIIIHFDSYSIYYYDIKEVLKRHLDFEGIFIINKNF